jgi:hypothetical protein
MGFLHLSMGSEHPSGPAITNSPAGCVMVVLAQPLTEKGACEELPDKCFPLAKRGGIRRTGVMNTKIGKQREQVNITDFLATATSSNILRIDF